MKTFHNWPMHIQSDYFNRGSRGLMDRALDLKPEVTQGCGFESRLWQEVCMTEVRTLSKSPNCSPGAAMSAAHCSTWMGKMQRTHFTPHYTLYNCVCDK